MAKRPVGPRSLVVVSDTHCGDKLALYPSLSEIRLDAGGGYRPSEAQDILWAWWRDFWDEWVPTVTHGEPYDVVINGDAVEGVHHRATHTITSNMKDQRKIAFAVLNPVAERCRKQGGRFYMVRGTEAHVGISAVDEEQLAEELKAVPNDVGEHARWELWKRIGGTDGPIVHCLHHIGTTSSSAHESSAVNAELAAEFVEAAKQNERPPNYVVRSHRHRHIAVVLETDFGRAVGITTPAWQLKTPYVFKVPGARLSQPQFGGIVIRRNDRTHYYESYVKHVKRPRIEE